MHLNRLLLLSAVISNTLALAIVKRDADFYNVRTHMHKDMSGRKGDPEGKYFREYNLRFMRLLTRPFTSQLTLPIDESM